MCVVWGGTRECWRLGIEGQDSRAYFPHTPPGACVLTICVVSGRLRDDVVSGRGGAGAAFGASGAGAGVFRWPGRRAGKCGQSREIPADPAGGELSRRAAAFPALAAVPGGWAGQAEHGQGRDDQPGPPGDLLGVAERGLVPAQAVLGEPVRVLDIETGAGTRASTGPGPGRRGRPTTATAARRGFSGLPGAVAR